MQLAKALRKTETTVKRWEMELHRPLPDTCEKLAALCDGELSQFFARHAGIPSDELEDYSKTKKSGSVPMGPPVTGTSEARSELPPEIRQTLNLIIKTATDLAGGAAEGHDAAQQKLDQLTESLGSQPPHRLSLLSPGQWPAVRVYGIRNWKKDSGEDVQQHVQVPVLSERDAEGPPQQGENWQFDSSLFVPASSAPRGPGFYIGLRIYDDAMAPLLQVGFTAIIDTKQEPSTTYRGQIVAAIMMEGIFIRRLGKASGSDLIILEPGNPAHPEIVIRNPEFNPILGRVVSWLGVKTTPAQPFLVKPGPRSRET